MGIPTLPAPPLDHLEGLSIHPRRAGAKWAPYFVFKYF